MKAIKIILKTVLLISLAIHGLLSAIVPANADVMTGVSTSCFPETGKPETYGSLTIDHSHASDGYIIVRAPKSSHNLKIAISFDGTAKIHYNLNTDPSSASAWPAWVLQKNIGSCIPHERTAFPPGCPIDNENNRSPAGKD